MSLWLRANPLVGDSLLAVFVLLLHIPIWWDLAPEMHPRLLYLLAGLLLVLPIAVRRRRPVYAAYLVLIGSLLIAVLDADFVVGTLATSIMIYTLVADVGRRSAALYTTLVGVVYILRLFPEAAAQPRGALPAQLLLIALVLGCCWFLGEFLGARRAYQAAIEQRVRSLELERDQRARIAVAEERNRIAREIHDVLAHSIGVMISQADGASYALRGQPELTEKALRSIGDTGRESLNELRNLLRVLRNPDEAETGWSPRPDAGGLHDLADSVRRLGLRVRLRLDGSFDDLPAGVGLSVYRIAQESLTNTLKHGGPASEATVTGHNDGEHIDIEVTDNGVAGESPVRTGSESADGNGLLGMRERASLYGGTLHAGPLPAGGWRVHARLPLVTSTHSDSAG